MKIHQDKVSTRVEAGALVEILTSALPEGWRLSCHDLGCIWSWSTRTPRGTVVEAGYIVIKTLIP